MMPIIFMCAENNNPIDSLIQVEKQFCETSIKQGIRNAFLAYLTDDAIIFEPRPVKGKPLYLERKKLNAVLTWNPIFADISKAGDLGYTTGPFEYNKNDSDSSKVYYGHYVSIWRKQGDGNWKVVLDVGISHAKINIDEVGFNNKQLSDPQIFSASQVMDKKIAKMKIQENEQNFSIIAKSKGIIEALNKFASKKIRVYRDGQFPFVGLNNYEQFIQNRNITSTQQPDDVFVANSGDLGYCYGISKSFSDSSDKIFSNEFAFLNIWKKQDDNNWRIVLNLTNEIYN